MEKVYQKEWLGLQFESFISISSKQIAGADFYKAFYQEFFKKYRHPNELDPQWVQLKLQAGEFLKEKLACGKDGKILSIGCGLGLMEEVLIKEGYQNLEITEVSEDSLRWLKPHIPPGKIHLGFFPECLPKNRLYDFIYLSGVEYWFDHTQLILFLKNVKQRLFPGGICLLISYSLKSEYGIHLIVRKIKRLTKLILEKLRIKSRGQFWGYARNRAEFFQAMSGAGFTRIVDGMLEKKTPWDTYWIEGRNQ